MYTGFVRQALS